MIGIAQRRAILANRSSGADALRAIMGGGAGLFIDFLDDSITIADLSTPANNYRGKPFDKLTFTRASTATRFNSAGLLETVASGVLRIDYDPVTRAKRGLLMEGARTNLFLWSEDLSQSGWWILSGASVGGAISRCGVSLSLLVENTANSTHQTQQGYTGWNAGTTYSVSIIAKAKERSRFCLTFGASAFSGYAIGDFDLVAQTATSTGGTSAICRITPLSDGCYLCTATATATTTTTGANVFIQLSNGSTTYTGNGTSGMYFGAAQLEAGAIPSSYIPTTSAQVTRAAEVCKILTSAFPATATGPYTLFCKGIWPLNNASDVTRVMYSLNNGSFNESRYIGRNVSAQSSPANIVGGASNVSFTPASVTPLAAFKLAVRHQLNDINFAVSGALPSAADTVCAVPLAPTQLNIGNLQDSGTSHWHGWIQQLAVIPVALTDAQLQAVTA